MGNVGRRRAGRATPRGRVAGTMTTVRKFAP
jgi:hypothetical protein